MGAALKVDWGSVKAWFIKGIEPTVIAEQFKIAPGTLQRRAHRGKWAEERKQAEKALSDHPRTILRQSDPLSDSVLKAAGLVASTMQEQKKRFLEAGGDVAMRGIELTRKHLREESTLRELSNVAAVSDGFTKVAKVVFGLNDNQVNVGVQLNVLSELPAEQMFEQLDATQAPESSQD